MAYFIGVNNTQGVTDQPPSVATSTQSKDVEVQINATNVTDKETALLALEKITLAITTGTWPPV
jgi:hypothetical protein